MTDGGTDRMFRARSSVCEDTVLLLLVRTERCQNTSSRRQTLCLPFQNLSNQRLPLPCYAVREEVNSQRAWN